jgi:hypothetical protein
MARAGDAARLAADEEARRNRPGFVRDPYLAPDPATIRQMTELEAERELGRPINDWEWQILWNGYRQDDLARFSAEQASFAAFAEATYRAEDTHAPQTTGTFESVDPVARFSERFENLFAKELYRKQRTEQVAGMTANLMGGLATGEAAVSR